MIFFQITMLRWYGPVEANICALNLGVSIPSESVRR